jgi:hypothetical protein
LHNCNDTHGHCPPAGTGCFPNSGNGTDWSTPYNPSHFGTQQYFLLPFLEQDNVYRNWEINFSNNGTGVGYPGGIDNPHDLPDGTPNTHSSNSWWSTAVLKVYQAPNDPTLPADGRTWATGADGQGRGATSYAANWHVFRGGWDEDWQVGGKCRIPATIPDGTSNTIAYFERYAICGDVNTAWGPGPTYMEHIWNEDGQNAGPVAQQWNDFAWATPCWWASYPKGTSPWFGNHNAPPSVPGLTYPFYYPFQFVTLPQNKPKLVLCDPTRLQAFNSGIMQVLLCDASTRGVNSAISQNTWATAIVPDDGLVLGSDW